MKMVLISRLFLALSILIPSLGFSEGMKIRCNQQQTICEVEDRRITVGDKIGVFSKNGYLIAVGRVSKIRDSIRVVKITKKFNVILKKHRAEVIKDKEAKKPKKYFKIAIGPSEMEWGASLGMMSMGVGDGFVATYLEGQFQWKWVGQTYFILKGNFLSGSGEASANLLGIPNTSVSLTSYGITGGISEVFLPNEPVSIRAYIGGGFGQSSVSIGADSDINEVLNNRVVNGTSLIINSEVSAIYNWGKYKPMVSFTYLSLHKSTNAGLSVGLMARI